MLIQHQDVKNQLCFNVVCLDIESTLFNFERFCNSKLFECFEKYKTDCGKADN